MASIGTPIPSALGPNKSLYQATVVNQEKALKPEPVRDSLACRIAKTAGLTLLMGAAVFVAGSTNARQGGSYIDNPPFYHWPVQEGYCTAPLKYSDATLNFLRWSEETVNSRCFDYIKDAIDSRIVQEIRADFPNVGKFAITASTRGHNEVAKVILSKYRSLDTNDIEKIYYNAHLRENSELVGLAIKTRKVPLLNVERDLASAVRYGEEKMVEALLTDKRLTSDELNKFLVHAVQGGYSSVVEVLLADSRVTSKGINDALASSSWVNPRITYILKQDSRYQPGRSHSRSNYHKNKSRKSHRKSRSVPPRVSTGCTASLPSHLSTGMKKRVQDIYKVYNKDKGCDPVKKASDLKVAEALLGVTERDSERAIKKAYRQAALIFHPDKCKKESNKQACTKAFQMISNAHDRLMPA